MDYNMNSNFSSCYDSSGNFPSVCPSACIYHYAYCNNSKSSMYCFLCNSCWVYTAYRRHYDYTFWHNRLFPHGLNNAPLLYCSCLNLYNRLYAFQLWACLKQDTCNFYYSLPSHSLNFCILNFCFPMGCISDYWQRSAVLNKYFFVSVNHCWYELLFFLAGSQEGYYNVLHLLYC